MADINQLITWGIGDPSGISFYILNGLGSGSPAPPVATGGGGAVPVRGWDGRHYLGEQSNRGNVQTIYRPRRVVLHPEPAEVRVRVTARFTRRFPAKPKDATRPAFPQPEAAPIAAPKPRPRRLALHPEALTLTLRAELSLETRETRHSKRVKQLQTEAETEARQLKRELENLQWELKRAKEEVIDLEDQLLLGVN